MSGKRFNRSFHDRVPLTAGEECEWKRHFRNVLREVIGYLESQAVKNDERFVFAFVDTITTRCNRYRKGKKPYSKIAVEQALAYLIELGIIARARNKEFRGRTQSGFIVAPHDLCCCLIYPDGRVEQGRNGFQSEACHCHYYKAALKGFKWNQPGVTTGKITFMNQGKMQDRSGDSNA